MDDYYLGVVVPVAYNFVPRRFSNCSGQIMAIGEYSALFSLLGTFYGGNGRTTFGLPDLRGRTAIGTGTGPGLTQRNIGQQVGTEYVSLDISTLPTHVHSGNTLEVTLSGLSLDLSNVTGTQRASNVPGDTDTAANAYLAASADGNDIYTEDSNALSPMKEGTIVLSGRPEISGTGTVTGDVSVAGGGEPHANMQPSLALNYCICIQGLYPSRS